MTCEGVLQMADVSKRKFKLKRDSLPQIRGTFDRGYRRESYGQPSEAILGRSSCDHDNAVFHWGEENAIQPIAAAGD